MTGNAKRIGRLLLLGAVLVPLAAAAQAGPGFGGGDCPGCPRAGARGARAFDPGAVTTVHGKIVDVQRVARGRHEGVHLTIAAGSERLEVVLGPDFYVDRQALKLANGDEVDVTGARTTLAGQPAIIAQDVRRGGEVLALRDANGVPLWRGQGMGRR